MKKFLTLTMVLSLTLGLFGCATPGTKPEVTSPVDTAPSVSTSVETTVPSIDVTDLNQFSGPMITVSMPLITEAYYIPGLETMLYFNRFQNVSLITEMSDAAQKIYLDLLNKLDTFSSVKSSVYESAQNDYKNQAYWYPYRTSVVYEPTRLDSTLVSFIGKEEVFDGTPTSATIIHSVTYDLANGETLSLKTILHDDFSADSLSELIIEGLSSYSEAILFGDYKNIIHDLFDTNVPVNAWYFSETGLVFYFNPYEIAPNSLGTVYSEVPYERLLGILKEQYFPDEKDLYSGTIQIGFADIASGSGLEQFARTAELNLEESAKQIVIGCDGSVTDLRIYMGSKNEDGSKFSSDAIVFSAYGIGPSDGIIIHANASTVAESLAISYVSNGETVFATFRLASDGSLIIE